MANKKLVRALAGELAVGPDFVVCGMSSAELARIPPGNQRFSEMYMPIWNHQHDTVVGVVEVYKASDPLFLSITHGKRTVWGVSIVSGLIICSILLGIMHRATRIIQRQRKDLIESESLAIVGELASAIAENVRDLLGSMRSSTEVVMEKDAAPSVQAQAGDVVVELNRLESLFQSLLAYARPVMPTPTLMRLRPVVDEVVQEWATVLEKQGVQFELSVCTELPLVLADPTSLQQVLNTAIANAQDAMPNGGTLSIEIVGSDDQKHVVIEIRDSGCGMTRDLLAKVFQPFLSTKPRGLGIGLALAKRVMERQGSTITLSSAVGCGTTVTLSLAVP